VATAAGTVIAGGVAQNGAVVDLWLASRFGSPPAYNAAPPSGAPDAGPVTSSSTFGAPGGWQITGVADGSFYVRVTYASNVYWSGPFAIDDDADLVHKAGPETISGLKTFNAGITVSGGPITLPAGSVAVAGLTGTLPLANGGTGSTTQNFADLTTPQTIGGVKTFSSIPVFSTGLTVSPGGTITVPNASIPYAAVIGLAGGAAGVDLGSSQIVTGQKTFDNDVPIVGGQLLGSAITTPSAPVVTPTGTTGATTYQYRIVAVTYDGRDSINSVTGQTTTGNATLSVTNYNALSWSTVTAAASYKVLKFVAGSWQLLAGNIVGTTYSDNGSATPSAYTLIVVNPGGEISGTTLTAATVQANAGTSGITAGRYIGTVPAAGPASGTWLANDYGFDSLGRIWVCTTGGTPGTWTPIFAETSSASIAGPPTTGAHIIGDRWRDKWGAVWICYTAGTPGLWRWGGGGCYTTRVYRNAAQTLGASGSPSNIILDTVKYDPTGSHNISTGFWTAPVVGVYRVSWEAKLQPATSQPFSNVVTCSDTTQTIQGSQVSTNGTYCGVVAAGSVSLAAGATLIPGVGPIASAVALQNDGPGQSNFMTIELAGSAA
jgi:hypothetical protein